MEVVFPDGKIHLYQIPTIKLENYTKDSIFEKNLLMLLPFYVMRYEKCVHSISENSEILQQLLNEYEEIRQGLNKELTQEGKSDLYTDLTDWIVKIADYIFRNEETARKGINSIMKGKILKLKSEELREEGREEERKLTAISLTKEGDSIEKIARVLHEDEETIKKWLSEN